MPLASRITGLDALGDGEHALIARLARQLVRDFLDDLVRGSARVYNRVPEADDDLTPGEARADVGVGSRGRVVALLGIQRHLVGGRRASVRSSAPIRSQVRKEYTSAPVPAMTRARRGGRR